MRVYLSKEFLLERIVGLPPVLSEILHIACIEKPGRALVHPISSCMPLNRYDKEGFHIEVKCQSAKI